MVHGGGSVCKTCARRCQGRAVCEACLCNSLARACKRGFFSMERPVSGRMNRGSFPGIPLAMFGSDSTQGRPSFDAIKEVTLMEGLPDGIGKKSASKKPAQSPSPGNSSEKENKPRLTVQNFQGDKRAFDRPVLQAQQARDSGRDLQAEKRAVEVPKLRGIIKNSTDEELLSFLSGNPGDPSQAGANAENEERPKKKVHFNLEEVPESQSTNANPVMFMSHRGLQIQSTRGPVSKEEKFANRRRLLGTKLGTPTSDWKHGGFEADGDFADETEELASSFQRLLSANPITARRRNPNSSVVRRIPLWQRRQLIKPKTLQLH